MNISASITGFLAWSRERFPAVNLLSAYLLFALGAATVRRDIHGFVEWFPSDLLIGLGLALHFLVLRVLDEHKDYQLDRVAHPHRVLQRGLVTLNQLKVLGAVAAAGTMIITIVNATGFAAYAAWALMMMWTAMMTVEFFVPNWLRQRLFLYSITHLMIVPFMIAWSAVLAEPRAFESPMLPWLLTLTPLNALIYEILRKTKGRDEEIEGVDTFSRLWGPTRAAAFGLALHVVSLVVVTVMAMRAFAPPTPWLIPLVLGVLLSIASLARYMKSPTAKSRKANEGAGALYVLIAYLSLIVFAAAT